MIGFSRRIYQKPAESYAGIVQLRNCYVYK